MRECAEKYALHDAMYVNILDLFRYLYMHNYIRKVIKWLASWEVTRKESG